MSLIYTAKKPQSIHFRNIPKTHRFYYAIKYQTGPAQPPVNTRLKNTRPRDRPSSVKALPLNHAMFRLAHGALAQLYLPTTAPECATFVGRCAAFVGRRTAEPCTAPRPQQMRRRFAGFRGWAWGLEERLH